MFTVQLQGCVPLPCTGLAALTSTVTKVRFNRKRVEQGMVASTPTLEPPCLSRTYVGAGNRFCSHRCAENIFQDWLQRMEGRRVAI